MAIYKDNQTQTGIEKLRETIERVLNHKLHTPKDFVMLSRKIFEQQKQTVSATTLKRIWNYLKNEHVETRETTLNILARFAGYKSWEFFLECYHDSDSLENEKIILSDPILPESLQYGQQIQLTWHHHSYCIIQYLGNRKFKVLKSCNSLLREDDRFECYFMLNYEPVYLLNLQHYSNVIHAFVLGQNGGVSISILKNGVYNYIREKKRMARSNDIKV